VYPTRFSTPLLTMSPSAVFFAAVCLAAASAAVPAASAPFTPAPGQIDMTALTAEDMRIEMDSMMTKMTAYVNYLGMNATETNATEMEMIGMLRDYTTYATYAASTASDTLNGSDMAEVLAALVASVAARARDSRIATEEMTRLMAMLEANNAAAAAVSAAMVSVAVSVTAAMATAVNVIPVIIPNPNIWCNNGGTAIMEDGKKVCACPAGTGGRMCELNLYVGSAAVAPEDPIAALIIRLTRIEDLLASIDRGMAYVAKTAKSYMG
jgi:hypothetical protein